MGSRGDLVYEDGLGGKEKKSTQLSVLMILFLYK